MQTIWRTELYNALKKITYSGKVIDLGGSKNAAYHAFIKGNRTIEAVNIDEKNGFDHSFDLEQKFPLADGVYDAVISLNVLEHIFNYQLTLRETHRILRPGGEIFIAVPFLIQVHPCPHDYWRYSGETLERILRETGFKDIEITPVGRGPFSAAAHILHNVFPVGFIRWIIQVKARACDALINKIKKGRYDAFHYPLGYIVTAKK